MRKVKLSDEDEILLKEAIRNQIYLIDCLPVDERENKDDYIDLIYRVCGYVV
jgi:hypothetical protein